MVPSFFIHVPKTAGTSFRKAAEAAFSADRILYDYGKQSVETSDLARRFLYETGREDRWGFYRALDAMDVALVGGHVGATRFVDGFGVDRSITFLREPLQRMASEYRHFCRHYGYEDTFRAFFSRPVMRNRMHKMMQGVPLEALGIVGLTERYEDSLDLVNRLYSWSLEVREDNLANEQACVPHEVDAEDEALFYRQNAPDVALYELACALFETRMDLLRRGRDYVHGKVAAAHPNRVTGWAWWAGERDDPVAVEVCVNDRAMKMVSAVELRPNLLRLAPPRGGHVGFSAQVDAQAGDRVSCRVAETGQEFPPEGVTVEEAQG